MTESNDNRVAIYLGPPTRAALADVPGQSRSGRINWIAAGYRAIVAHELRAIAWSRNEWCAVMDVLNGSQIGGLGSLELQALQAWANLADAPEMAGKWRIDVDDLVGRWRALSAAGKVAVYEAAARFWARAELPTDEALAAAGVRPRSDQ